MVADRFSRKEAMQKLKEKKCSQNLYEVDVQALRVLQKDHPGWTFADAARLCIEYSRAHGVFK